MSEMVMVIHPKGCFRNGIMHVRIACSEIYLSCDQAMILLVTNEYIGIIVACHMGYSVLAQLRTYVRMTCLGF